MIQRVTKTHSAEMLLRMQRMRAECDNFFTHHYADVERALERHIVDGHLACEMVTRTDLVADIDIPSLVLTTRILHQPSGRILSTIN